VKRRSLLAVVAALALAGRPLAAQLTPPATGGGPTLDQLLQRLGENRRVLVVGAHPDDEDTELLAWLVQAKGAEAAYLSLTRGEGGQNLIGDQLGVALGLIRSRELEAARAIDGARQYFTRAYDFGYTRSLAETERFWPPDSILKDVVRIVRRFQPHVIVPVFSGTSRDGHGQHTMSGVMARQAFEVAGDPNAFHELETEEGLRPWTPLKLYRATRFDPGATTVTIPVGEIDPRTGKTYHQIAMASRSQHRSQNFGVLQRTGPQRTQLALLERRTPDASEAEPFSGIPTDTSWLARTARTLRASIAPVTMSNAVGALAAALRRLEVDSRDRAPPEREVEQLSRALLVAASVVVDAVAPAERVTPGERFEVEVTVYNGGDRPVTITSLGFVAPENWQVPTERLDSVLPPDSALIRRLSVVVAPHARPTQPYFLHEPPDGPTYDWSGVPPGLRGELFEPPLLQLRVGVDIDGARALGFREVAYRYGDQVLGEVRRPVRVVPAIEVRLSPDRLVWSSGGDPVRQFTVSVMHNGTDSVRGEVALAIDGWPGPAPQAFALGSRGATQAVTFTVRRPAAVTRGAVSIRAVARAQDGRQFGEAVNLVDYPHIRPTPYVVTAESEVTVAPITLPALHAIGYVRGASDRVPDALMGLGLPITLLDAAALASGDLSRFDAIVIGARAYEANTALVEHNHRLLAYVRDGGYLLVQYQQYQLVRGGYAPYPLDISRPHDRITDETAPVRILEPRHPVFHHPHEIGPADWVSWPQERGLYFAGTWDDRYRPLLEMQDPDMPPMRGGLLVAEYGRGTYVYTAISFFRSLPAGNAGATRLFLNLLALGER
jgi:LmbE family N-acetylglucosaminyl deacetylase